jgi:hypothetical protein
MIDKEPTAELDSQFSSDDATPIPWAEGRERLEEAEVYWISTVRPFVRAHLTPLPAVWLDGALYFSTGPDVLQWNLQMQRGQTSFRVHNSL